MHKLIPLYAACFFLAIMSERSSIYDEQHDKYIYKERKFYTLLVIITCLFAGLRTQYNDTDTYIHSYQQLDVSDGLLSGVKFSLGEYPAYNIVRNILKMCRFSAQSYIMIFSVFFIGVSLWFVRKYTNSVSLSVFLFFTTGYFDFTLAAIKQCAAISVCLIAIDKFLNNRVLEFFLLVTIATLFHPFSMVFFVVPLLDFKPWTVNTIVLILVCIIVGISMQNWLNRAIDVIALMDIDYDKAVLIGEGVNIFRFLVVFAPLLVSFITQKYWIHNNDRKQNLMINLMMMNAGTMFIALFGNPIYFGRLANYFLIFQSLSIPMILKCFEKYSRFFVTGCVIVLFCGYNYYGEVLNGMTFDQMYSSISLLKYLTHVFE